MVETKAHGKNRWEWLKQCKGVSRHSEGGKVKKEEEEEEAQWRRQSWHSEGGKVKEVERVLETVKEIEKAKMTEIERTTPINLVLAWWCPL